MKYTPFLFNSLIINSWITENEGSRWFQSPAIIQPKYSVTLSSSFFLFSLFSFSLYPHALFIKHLAKHVISSNKHRTRLVAAVGC